MPETSTPATPESVSPVHPFHPHEQFNALPGKEVMMQQASVLLMMH